MGLEKARFPEAVAAFPQWVGLDSAGDGVIQYIDLHRFRCLVQMSGRGNVRTRPRWATG